MGTENSDFEANACRSDCQPARCGDGVIDEGESCDDGERNSDARADACRLDCRPARCGDGHVDTGEACDEGAKNSDDTPDACRAHCQRPRCGDGVVDTGEECDEGDENTDSRALGSCNLQCVVVDAAHADNELHGSGFAEGCALSAVGTRRESGPGLWILAAAFGLVSIRRRRGARSARSGTRRKP